MAAFRRTDGRIRAVAVDGRATYAQGIQVVIGALVSDLDVVEVALNCDEALEAIAEHSPDVVLIGAPVPGANGLQVAAAVRSRFPAVKILMLSPSPSSSETARAMGIGVNGYLPRDCDAEELVSAIRALVTGEIVIAPPVPCVPRRIPTVVHQEPIPQRAAIGIRKGGRVK